MALSRFASFRKRFVTLTLAGAAVIAIAGCYGQPLSTREKGTLAGGAIGAGSGAIVGAAVGAPLAGAAIGGVVGAGTGMAIGNSMQNHENRYGD
jgi:phage tail tape-measure protein